MRHLDLTGSVFGHLTVQKVLTFRDSGRRSLCLCLCDCGRECSKRVDKLHASLRTGRSIACPVCSHKAKVKSWQRTREKGLENVNPHAPRVAITHLNYLDYLKSLTCDQCRRYIRLVWRHRHAYTDERRGMDQIRAEAVELVILEPEGVVESEVEVGEIYDYRWEYAE